MITTFSRRLLAASMLALAACSGKKSSTGPVTPTASISVSSGSATVSVEQGTSGSAAITVGRTNYSGDITLSAEGLPTGVTATFTPTTLTAGATTSTLALAAGSTSSAGTSTVTVRARGSGVTDATTTIGLTVTVTPTGSVSLSLAPAAATITAGQSVTSTVTITRAGGFTGGVNLTLTGAPSGLTSSFSASNPVTGNSVTLSLGTAASVVPGPYTLTVRANATGLTEATASYVLTVNPPPSNNVTWRYCSADRIPLWFAYQDGTDGTWQRVTPTSSGVYDFGYGQPVVGIAAVYDDRGTKVTDVRYYATSEIAAAAAAECTDNPAAGTKTVTGTVTGFGSSAEFANIAVGTAVSGNVLPSSPSFTIPRLQTGARDLIAARVDGNSNTVVRLLLLRGTNYADNSAIGTLDLGGVSSFAPATGSLTITAPNDGTMIGTTNFLSATGTGLSLALGAVSGGVSTPYTGVPAAQLVSTDQQRVTITQNTSTSITRVISRYIAGPSAITMAMPSDPGAPTVTAVSGSTTPRATAAGTVLSAFNGQVRVTFDQFTAQRRWLLSSTNAARNASLNYSLTMPDFTAVPGWNTAWQLVTGSADVTASFSGQTGAGTNGQPVDGTTTYTISRKITFSF